MSTPSTASPKHVAMERDAQQLPAEFTDNVKIQWQQPIPVPKAGKTSAVFWVGLVVALALMSFYVHVLNEQVHRGEHFSSVQRTEVQATGNRQGEQRRVALAQARQRGQR